MTIDIKAMEKEIMERQRRYLEAMTLKFMSFDEGHDPMSILEHLSKIAHLNQDAIPIIPILDELLHQGKIQNNDGLYIRLHRKCINCNFTATCKFQDQVQEEKMYCPMDGMAKVRPRERVGSPCLKEARKRWAGMQKLGIQVNV